MIMSSRQPLVAPSGLGIETAIGAVYPCNRFYYKRERIELSCPIGL